ncbi:MAG: nucleotide exchange factor GrpE [Flavobacteriales bacterium]|nr:MAG: nucleotide exchange factor GrpE [Flavobacteriales bacterium]
MTEKDKDSVKGETLAEEEQVKTDNPENNSEEKDSTSEEADDGKSAPEEEKSPEEELADLNDRFLRLYSEFDNYKRRTAKERLELFKTAGEDIIVSLLPVLDDFDRAMKAAEDAKEGSEAKQGMELIKNKLMVTLKQKGLEPMDSMGKPFDTDNHEAITKIPAPKKKLKGKVVDVIEKGFLLNGKVIRHAKVVVGS